MEYREEDWLQISGLQHFSFCRRQWALIHIEQQWAENLRTTEGKLMHERAHDASSSERRGKLLIVRDLRVFSAELGISGACDVVEFRQVPDGIPLRGEKGRWSVFPVEYKHGESKENDADRLQLCAQAMCLEKMLGTVIPAGALFYETPRRREAVEFDAVLREKVCRMLDEMHALFRRGYTPKVKPNRSCNACSLKELCLPRLCRNSSAADYLNAMLGEETEMQ
ncbi:MAG: CRISPR-associated protein Cas4 [Firmicutes bacterium]|nr:CRISPR-associated protein Cas4 [Bacillota bacterium]